MKIVKPILFVLAIAFGVDIVRDYVHNRRHDPSAIVRATAQMYTDSVYSSQDDQIRIVFGVTHEYKPIAEAFLHDDTVIGIEAPKWISGFGGGFFEPYNPETHKFVRSDELKKEDNRIYVAEDERKVEIVSPKQNRAFNFKVNLNRSSGIYDISEFDSSYRILGPFGDCIGEQHNQFLTEEEQKKYGTYPYFEEKRKVDELRFQLWEKYGQDGQITSDEFRKVDVELMEHFGKSVLDKAAFRPKRLNPYISILDHSKTYVDFVRSCHMNKFFNPLNWRMVAEESMCDIRSGKIIIIGEQDMTLARVKQNSTTLDGVDIILYGRWPKANNSK